MGNYQLNVCRKVDYSVE